jgi:predicted transcriptional regulator
MGNRGMLDLMGPTERQILQILWRDGPSTVAHLQTQLGGAPYTTVASPLQSLQKKGFVTRTGAPLDYRYHALPKQALLVLVCERHLAELEATPVERAHVVEALRHG